MDDSNKQLILKEIETWRKSRLLPAEYCDFLSNLYAEGESLQPDSSQHSWRPLIEWKRLLLSLAGSTILVLLVLHFTSFPSWMQIGFLLTGTILFYFLAFRLPLPFHSLRVGFLTIGSLLVAADGYLLAERLRLLESPAWSLSALVVVLLIWVVTGAAGESRMIVTAAWIGIGALYEFALIYMRNIGFDDYAFNSLYWLIFAAVSMGLGVFLGRNRLFIAPVWAVSAVVALLAPDFLFLFSGSKPYFLVDTVAFLKISLIVTAVVVFREGIKNWLDRFRNPEYNKKK
jgi:hypothetical protein